MPDPVGRPNTRVALVPTDGAAISRECKVLSLVAAAQRDAVVKVGDAPLVGDEGVHLRGDVAVLVLGK